MTKVNNIMFTKTSVFENSVKSCYGDCLQILACMSKNINYSANGKKQFFTFADFYKGFRIKFELYQKAQKNLRDKKMFNKRFANYKTIYKQQVDNKLITMKTNGFFFIVQKQTKNGFESYKFDNLKQAKQKFSELAK